MSGIAPDDTDGETMQNDDEETVPENNDVMGLDEENDAMVVVEDDGDDEDQDEWELNDAAIDVIGLVPQYSELLLLITEDNLAGLSEAVQALQFRHRSDLWQYDTVYKKSNAWSYNIVGFAVLLQRRQILRFLVEQGADIGKPADKDGLFAVMPIGQAAWDGDLETVQYLQRMGANFDEAVSYGESSLSWACTRGQEAVARHLLYHSANIFAETEAQQNPLMNACTHGNAAVVQLLVAFGAEVNAVKLNGVTALMIASELGHSEAVRYLLSLPDIEVDATDQVGEKTALHCAIGNMHLEVVRMLVARGADVHVRFMHGLTAFLLACATNSLELLQYLANEGKADIRDVDHADHTGLMIACYSDAPAAVVQFLLSAGIDVNAISTTGRTALQLALSKEAFPLASLLVTQGADVNAQPTADKRTALMFACGLAIKSEAVLDFIKTAIEHHANIQLEDKDGHTARHFVLATDHLPFFDELVAMHAERPFEYFSSMIRPSLLHEDLFQFVPEYIAVAFIHHQAAYLKQLLHWRQKTRPASDEHTAAASSSSSSSSPSLPSREELWRTSQQWETKYELVHAYGKTEKSFQDIPSHDVLTQARTLLTMVSKYIKLATNVWGAQHVEVQHIDVHAMEQFVENDGVGAKLASIKQIEQTIELNIEFIMKYESGKFVHQSAGEGGSVEPVVQMLVPRKKKRDV